MEKSKLRIEKNKDIYLSVTHVENIFINELLPVAPGDYVKVYLFCLMYAEQGVSVSPEMVSKSLHLTLDEIDKAWKYWEDWGVIKRTGTRGSQDYEVVFLNQIGEYCGRGSRKEHRMNIEPASQPDDREQDSDDVLTRLTDRELQALFEEFERTVGRPISRSETSKIADAIELYGVTPDVLSYAIKYCADIEKFSIDYIYKVALRWKEEGCMTILDVKALLDRHSRRNSDYASVFRELGFNRLTTPGDREIMDKWFDVWGFMIDEVLRACKTAAGLREPSLKYVNKVLENKRLEAGGIRTEGAGETGRQDKGKTASVSRKVLDEYYQHLRILAENSYMKRKEELSEKLPIMKKLLALEDELNRSLTTFDFSTAAKERRKLNKEKLTGLKEEKKKILKENGYPEDYLEMKYRCGICRDTGTTDDGIFCSCAKERAEEAYKWNKARNSKQ